MQVLHGKICAAIVTPGKDNDSPHLREMIGMLPQGSGYVIADSMYGGKNNCNAIRDSGRTPIMEPKAGYRIKGFNARAQTLRFYEEHPRTFKILRKRNNVESLFSPVKARFKGWSALSRNISRQGAAFQMHLLQPDLRLRSDRKV